MSLNTNLFANEKKICRLIKSLLLRKYFKWKILALPYIHILLLGLNWKALLVRQFAAVKRYDFTLSFCHLGEM